MSKQEPAVSQTLLSSGDEPSMVENTLVKYRWVRIMADYDVSVWDVEGTAQVTEDLPVSPDLQRRLDEWSSRCDDLESSIEGASLDRAMGSNIEFPLEDWGSLAREGRQIALAVKQELPNWTVIYHDKDVCRKCAPQEPRSSFEYEIMIDEKGP
jgi:hypothetical protein